MKSQRYSLTSEQEQQLHTMTLRSVVSKRELPMKQWQETSEIMREPGHLPQREVAADVI